MDGCIAVLNAGSSSIKFALYDADSAQRLLYRGQLEKIGVAPHFMADDADGVRKDERDWPAEGFDHAAATRELLSLVLDLLGGRPVRAVGHRVVHGGMKFPAPVVVNRKIMAQLAKLSPLAPLHQPHNLAPIEAIAEAAPQIPQVACFDTAFHHHQAPLAQMFGLPRRFTDAGVRRYGFHGLSYEYVAECLREIAPGLAAGKVIVAHLGNGASLCAIDAGRSVASTMGFTAVDGLLMGTRCGSLDPGAVIYLMDSYGMDARAIEDLVYRKSGLLGVSGVSSDMRTLRASHDPRAAEAIALFTYRIAREIGSLAAAMGGVDGLVFTGGIGTNDAALRSEVAEACGWLGLELSPKRNAAGQGRISRKGSKLAAWVVPTDEELMIARHTTALVDQP